MKIIKPRVELMHTGLEKEIMAPEQLIEKVGRTCYKSEDKITDTSAPKFVDNLIRRGHEAMIEHWAPIFRTNAETYEEIVSNYEMLMHNSKLETGKHLRPYLRFTDSGSDNDCRCIVSGNMRAWRDFAKACMDGFGFLPAYLHNPITLFPIFFPEFQDHEWDDTVFSNKLEQISVDDLVGPVEHGVHHNVTVKFTCDRGVSHEIVRHRVASFAQESTRYCNYSLGKYGNEITVVSPARWIDADESLLTTPAYRAWYLGCLNSERYYFDMLNAGCIPQEARAVLPNSLKTEVIVTMNLYGWEHFFGLRCAIDAHPDIQVVANMARELFDAEVYPHV